MVTEASEQTRVDATVHPYFALAPTIYASDQSRINATVLPYEEPEALIFASDQSRINATVLPYVAPTANTYASDFSTANASVLPVELIQLHTIVAGQRIPMRIRTRLRTEADRRRKLLVGQFFPDASTTGIYDASLLTVVSGNQTLTTPGQHFENKHFRGRVDIRASGISFRNCLFTGPAGSAQNGGIVVATNAAGTGAFFEDCTFAPEHKSHVTNCFEGHKFRWLRVNAYHGVDACSIIAPAGTERADAVIEGSWLHDLTMFNTNTQPDNVTHNDVIQWHGMKGLTVHGSRLEGWCAPGIGDIDKPPVGTWPSSLVSGNPFYPKRWSQGAGVMASPPRAMFDDFIFTNNWVDGTTVGLNLTRDDGTFDDCGTITGNRFGYDWRLGSDFAVLAKSAQTMVLEDNVRWNAADPWDSSIPFNVRKQG